MGVRHAPREPVAESMLRGKSAYITDAAISVWIRELTGVMPPGEELNPTTAEGYAAFGLLLDQALGSLEQSKRNKMLQQIFFTIAQGEEAQDLMAGAYRGSNKNPIFALEAFILAHQADIYPPLWVLDWLYDAFVSYVGSDCEKDLLTLLGINRGKGKSTLIGEARTLKAEVAAMQEMAILNSFGVSIADSAVMVSGRYEAADATTLSPDTLVKYFKHRKWSAFSRLLKPTTKHFSRDAIKADIAAIYPAHTIPNRWK